MKKYLLYIGSVICGVTFGICWLVKKCEGELLDKEKRAKRNGQSLRVACKWIRVVQNGKKIKSYFEKNGFQSVAIYGMGELGKCLLQELEKNNIEIKYTIDSNPNKQVGEYQLFLPEDNLPKVQAVIVTPSYDFAEISEMLKKRTDAFIISIDEILDDISI